MIYRREEYIQEDEKSAKYPVKHIDAMVPVGGGKPRFVGSVTLGLQTALGVQSMPISFEIQAETIEEAFDKFETAAEPKIDEAPGGKIIDLKNLRPDG